MTYKVAILEDEKNYNEALKKILEYDEEMVCVGQFYSFSEAIEKIPSATPDVVLTDIKLPDENGIEVISQLKPKMENTHFIMCTSFEDDENIYNAMKTGASGYLIKGEPMEKILNSIKDVVKGGAPMSFGIAKRVLSFFREDHEQNPALEQLTTTENEVLEFLAKGMLYKEIADEKFVSIDTVKKHVCNIYRKLHVNNKVEAINIYNQKK